MCLISIAHLCCLLYRTQKKKKVRKSVTSLLKLHFRRHCSILCNSYGRMNMAIMLRFHNGHTKEETLLRNAYPRTLLPLSEIEGMG